MDNEQLNQLLSELLDDYDERGEEHTDAVVWMQPNQTVALEKLLESAIALGSFLLEHRHEMIVTFDTDRAKDEV